MQEASRRKPGNLPLSECSSSSVLSINEPFGSTTRRRSQDWLGSLHATRTAESRDRAARDCGNPPRSAKTTCHIICHGPLFPIASLPQPAGGGQARLSPETRYTRAPCQSATLCHLRQFSCSAGLSSR